MTDKTKDNGNIFLWILKSIGVPFGLLFLFIFAVVFNITYCGNLFEKGEMSHSFGHL